MNLKISIDLLNQSFKFPNFRLFELTSTATTTTSTTTTPNPYKGKLLATNNSGQCLVTQAPQEESHISIVIAQCTSSVYHKLNGACACAFVLPGTMSWSDANSQCKAKGARLPEIFSDTENADSFNLKVCWLLFSIFLINIVDQM